jgi:hypothetical protein
MGLKKFWHEVPTIGQLFEGSGFILGCYFSFRGLSKARLLWVTVYILEEGVRPLVRQGTSYEAQYISRNPHYKVLNITREEVLLQL